MSALTRPLRVLVVDVTPHARRSLFRALREQHDVAVVESVLDALDLLRWDANFDVILCELQMPELDGFDFYARLKQMDRELVTRVLFVCGQDTLTSRQQLFATTEKLRILLKPLSGPELLSSVNALGELRALGTNPPKD